MMMTDDERRAYQRGYYAGRQNMWPVTMPPLPPGAPLTRDVVVALKWLRDAVRGELAKFEPDDELAATLEESLAFAEATLARFAEYTLVEEER